MKIYLLKRDAPPVNGQIIMLAMMLFMCYYFSPQSGGDLCKARIRRIDTIVTNI
jgi:hypothetical protein